jgi:hypothetical protein
MQSPTDELESLKRAVENLHGVMATFVESVIVKEAHNGKVVWSGSVSVFEVRGHPSATRCYAWTEPVEGSSRRRYFAILALPPVDSPVAAVRAAIVAEHRRET